MPIYHNVDLKQKLFISIKRKDGHYVLVKRKIHLEDITVVNIHVFNVGAASFITQTLKAQ